MMKEELNSRGDDFEQRLQRVPQYEPPSAWRGEILATAKKSAASVHAPRPTPHGFLASLIQSLTTLARPQRLAWGSLAAIWMIITAMNLSSRDHSQASTAQHPLPPADVMQALREQKLLFLAELAGQPAPRETIRPQPVPIGPRSQRRDETFSV
jgi:hypothetical protein